MTHPRFSLVALDCPDPIELATFYSRLTGMDVEPLGDLAPSEVTWIELINNGAPTIAFQKVDDFVAPTWPSAPIPQQLHIDLDVDDLDTGERLALSLGATKPEFQPGTSFRVYLDPVGHPFCLVSTS